jgi:hypothetical protein
VGIDESIRRSLTVSSHDGTDAEGTTDPQSAADTDPSWAGGVVSIGRDGRVRHDVSGRFSRALLHPRS